MALPKKYANARYRRRFKQVKASLLTLSEGKAITRAELFADPHTKQHLAEQWELNFLNRLTAAGVIQKHGSGPNRKYFLFAESGNVEREFISNLLTDDAKLAEFAFHYSAGRKNEQDVEAPVQEAAEENIVDDDSPAPYKPDETPDALELIALRIQQMLEVLVGIKEAVQSLDSRLAVIETELGIKKE